MAKGPKYNYFNVRDDLRIADGTYSGQISFGDSDMNISSSTDGTLNINANTALTASATTVTLDGNTTLTTSDTFTVIDGAVNLGTGALTLGGATTLSDDLTRRYARHMSGASTWTLPTGYTRLIYNQEIIDDGIVILSGVSGNLRPKLPSTPSIGKRITITYNDSGATATYTAKLSGNSIKIGSATGHGTYYYASFSQPGQSITLINDGTSYYLVHPSGAGGPTFSTT